MNSTKQERIETVNKIIEAIASTGRRFFYNKGNDFTAKIILKKGRLFLIDDYTQQEIYLHMPDYRRWRNFSHGGTMQGLVRDFKDFIMTGEYSNHNNGYGGLYCPHWGYSKEEMKTIQDKAVELGYLIEGKIP